VASIIEDESVRTLIYVLAAIFCGVTGIARLRRFKGRRLTEGSFCLGLCVLLLVMAFLKEAGVQLSLGNELRAEARTEGWYGDRRVYQALIAWALVASTAFVLLIVLILMRDSRRSLGPPFVAAGMLLCFVAVRALSLHQTDALLYRRQFIGVQINALLEVALVLLTALSSLQVLTGAEVQRAPSGLSSGGGNGR
jgi:hypothetical protein